MEQQKAADWQFTLDQLQIDSFNDWLGKLSIEQDKFRDEFEEWCEIVSYLSNLFGGNEWGRPSSGGRYQVTLITEGILSRYDNTTGIGEIMVAGQTDDHGVWLPIKQGVELAKQWSNHNTILPPSAWQFMDPLVPAHEPY